MNIHVEPPSSPHSVWRGGSILSSQASFMQKWISKEQYDEVSFFNYFLFLFDFY